MRELGHRVEGNVAAAEQVHDIRVAGEKAAKREIIRREVQARAVDESLRRERIAEERARKATAFHAAGSQFFKDPYVKGTSHEIDLSQKPFSTAITKIAKKSIAQEQARRTRRAQKLVAERHKEALSPSEAKMYVKEAVEAKELQQK